MPQLHTEFNWAVYANATLAGLAALIPVPFLDWAFERFFRRRMLPAIADCRQCQLSPEVQAVMQEKTGETSCLRTCLTLPVVGLVILIKRLSRKILYFLAIQEATDKLSYYWHEAFLIDYMVTSGYLDEAKSARIARATLDYILTEEITTSPLFQLAKQITSSSRHVFRSLIGARRGQEDDVIKQKKLQIVEHWNDFSEYFEQLAARYEQKYQEMMIAGLNLEPPASEDAV